MDHVGPKEDHLDAVGEEELYRRNLESPNRSMGCLRHWPTGQKQTRKANPRSLNRSYLPIQKKTTGLGAQESFSRYFHPVVAHGDDLVIPSQLGLPKLCSENCLPADLGGVWRPRTVEHKMEPRLPAGSWNRHATAETVVLDGVLEGSGVVVPLPPLAQATSPIGLKVLLVQLSCFFQSPVDYRIASHIRRYTDCKYFVALPERALASSDLVEATQEMSDLSLCNMHGARWKRVNSLHSPGRPPPRPLSKLSEVWQCAMRMCLTKSNLPRSGAEWVRRMAALKS